MSVSKNIPLVWHVGGNDVHMRVPLLLELRERGFKVGAVGSQRHPLFRQHQIPFHYYPLPPKTRPFAELRAKIALTCLFQRHRPDVVHAFDTRPAILVPLAARQVGIPARVRTITGMGRLFSSTSPAIAILRSAYRHFQRYVGTDCVTVFQNEDDHQYFRKHQLVTDSNAALVPGSGVDIAKILQESANAQYADPNGLPTGNKLVVTMIARLIWQKGVREFLRAASLIAKHRQDVEFLLVGPLSTEGRHQVTLQEIHQLAPGVQYLGIRDDIPAILSKTDIFVLPSYYREGVPRVLLEAGALGIPLVTTDSPGCRDVVRHEREGLIVPPRDEIALSLAIHRLLDSPELRHKYGLAVRKHVQNQFSLASVAEAYAAIYRQALRAG
jgi:glycosyltransferase involved in cell wall biosynthesis